MLLPNVQRPHLTPCPSEEGVTYLLERAARARALARAEQETTAANEARKKLLTLSEKALDYSYKLPKGTRR